MNKDELEMILTVLREISNSASNAGMLWMALHYGSKLLHGLGGAITFIIFLYVVYRVITTILNQLTIGGRIAEKVGMLSYNGDYNKDREHLLKTIDELVAKK